MAWYGCVRTALSVVLAAATVFSSRRSQMSLAFSMALSNFARMFVFSLSSVAIAFIFVWFLLVLSYVSAIAACRAPIIMSRAKTQSVAEATGSQGLVCQKRCLRQRAIFRTHENSCRHGERIANRETA